LGLSNIGTAPEAFCKMFVFKLKAILVFKTKQPPQNAEVEYKNKYNILKLLALAFSLSAQLN